jgi:hypothetical protein
MICASISGIVSPKTRKSMTPPIRSKRAKAGGRCSIRFIRDGYRDPRATAKAGDRAGRQRNRPVAIHRILIDYASPRPEPIPAPSV